LVGERGHVYGLDMTEEQLAVARASADEYCRQQLGYSRMNMTFLKGYIEYPLEAGVNPESIDIAVSNCVVNLSPAKERVLAGVYDVLKPGGEFYFSDVYVDRRLPEHVRNHEVLYGECISGAMYVEDFVRLCRRVGFTDARVVERKPFAVNDPELADIVGNAKFFSITYRLFKLAPGELEDKCEDYGQIAYYRGGIPGSKHVYMLDEVSDN
jgi:arsenite methyltransferase